MAMAKKQSEYIPQKPHVKVHHTFVGLGSSSQLMAQLFIILEWPLDPFLVREGDHKLNFIPLKHLLFFAYGLHIPPVPF